MAYYRLYFLDPASGHIDRFEEFDAADDGAAVAVASQSIGEAPLELWSGARKVQRLDAVQTIQPKLRPRGLGLWGAR